jgi:uncharacterized protein (TIGR02453 family)
MKFTLPASTFTFLKQLAKNNNRDWFNEHKDRFLEDQLQVEQFANALLAEMNLHDGIETESGKKSMHRIYRDTRFSKVKTPYKNNWSGSFRRATKNRRGGYYWHLEPGGNSMIAGGFWGPNPEDLKHIRDGISADPEPLQKYLKSKPFLNTFGELHGEQLKTKPKGFEADDPAIDLIRYKQFLLFRKFSDKEVLSPGFVKQANDTFKKMRPFLDYMTEILTMDANGLPIV